MLTGDGKTAPCIQSWFLLTLFLTEILFYLLDKLFRNEVVLMLSSFVFAALGWASTQYSLNRPLFWHLDVAFFSVLFFWTGYFFRNYWGKRIEQLSEIWKWVCSVGFLAFGAVFQELNGRVSMNASYYGRILYYLPSALASIVGFTFLSMAFLNKSRILCNVGKHSMFYLGYHAFLLTILKRFVPFLYSTWYLTVITSILCLLIVYFPAIYGTKYVPVMVGKWWKKS